jgi:hypothetical protein
MGWKRAVDQGTDDKKARGRQHKKKKVLISEGSSVFERLSVVFSFG